MYGAGLYLNGTRHLLMTKAQDMHLGDAVKRAMGSHYANNRSCVENIQRLVNNYDDLVEKQELDSTKIQRLQDQLDAIPGKLKIMADLFPNRLGELIDELSEKGKI